MIKIASKKPLVGSSILAFIVTTFFLASQLSAQTNSFIEGVAWRDTNADSVQNIGEPLLEGALVTLYNSSNVVVAGPIATDSMGAYSFSGLGAETYRVEILAPGNFIVNAPSADNDFTPVVANNRVGEATVVVDGTNGVSGIDAAIRPKPELDLGITAGGVEDGSGPFDTEMTCTASTDIAPPGDDCGPDNGQVRTQDAVVYPWSVTANDYESGQPNLDAVMFEQIITPGPNAVISIDNLPLACAPPPTGVGGTVPPSQILTDTPVAGAITLVCNLGEFSDGQQKSFDVPVNVSGNSYHGSDFVSTQRVYSVDTNGAENAVPVTGVGPITTIVSARPQYDLMKNFVSQGFYNQSVGSRNVGFGSEPGYFVDYSALIAADGGKGVEAMAMPVTITERVFATTSDGSTPYTTGAGFEYYITEC
ncbi:MAG: SdrD B-like domain-containing protein, partial [Chloroflexota bacterium]